MKTLLGYKVVYDEELIQKTAQVWAACDVPVLEFLVPLNDMKVHVGRMVQVEVAEVVAAE